jgi:hypothetical protein
MTRYVLTQGFREGVRDSALTHHALARTGGLAHADFSRFLQGTHFGERSRRLLLLIGQALGLSGDKCCQIYSDPILTGESLK